MNQRQKLTPVSYNPTSPTVSAVVGQPEPPTSRDLQALQQQFSQATQKTEADMIMNWVEKNRPQDWLATALSDPNGARSIDEIYPVILAIAERDKAIAQAGLVPDNTVQGKIEFLKFAMQAFIDSKLVPIQLTQTFREIELKIRVLDETSSETIRKAQAEAEEARIKAEMATGVAARGKEVATKRGQFDLEHLDKDLGVQSQALDVKRKEQSVGIIKEAIKVQVEEEAVPRFERRVRLLRRAQETQLDIDAIKRISRPLVSAVITGCLLLIILSNLVADAPGRENTFFLGLINDIWDGLYDVLVKDGILRIFRHYFG